MRDLLNASLAKSTKQSYGQSISCYKLFHSLFYFKQHTLFPISVTKLANFIAFMVHKGYTAATIQTKVAGLSYVHTLKGYPNPSSHFLIKKILKGCKKQRLRTDTRLPITIPILCSLIVALPRLHRLNYYHTMYKAMFLIAFYALLRVGEFTTHAKQGGHTLLRKDISFEYEGQTLKGVLLHLKHFKHSKRPVTLSVKASHKLSMCPVAALRAYTRQRCSCKGPLFVNQDCSPVTSYQFSAILRQGIIDMGLNPKVYKPHSLRIGGATRAHQANLSESQIMALGRWSSSSYLRYIRVPIVPTL